MLWLLNTILTQADIALNQQDVYRQMIKAELLPNITTTIEIMCNIYLTYIAY